MEGHFPGKTETVCERGVCAQMADNMGAWTTSAAYHQETVNHTHTHGHTQLCESPWLRLGAQQKMFQ